MLMVGMRGRPVREASSAWSRVVQRRRPMQLMTVAARLAGIPVLIWDKLDQPHGMLDQLQLPLANRNLQ